MKQKKLLVIFISVTFSMAFSLSSCAQQTTQILPTSAPTKEPVLPTELATATILATAAPIPTVEPPLIDFIVLSSAFNDGADIPQLYTCDGDDISPPLYWDGVPKGTQSLAVFVHDVDAGFDLGATTEAGFAHWLVFNIPPEDSKLDESIPPGTPLDNGALQGENDAARFINDQKLAAGYFGPCPPPGSKHKYVFSVYALDTMLNLPMGAKTQEFLDAIDNHVIEESQLVGYYQSTK